MVKNFEVWVIRYQFDKYKRRLMNVPCWVRYKGYSTIEGATDAIRAFRHNWATHPSRDYPAMGDVQREHEFPHITPSITAKRFKICLLTKTLNVR